MVASPGPAFTILASLYARAKSERGAADGPARDSFLAISVRGDDWDGASGATTRRSHQRSSARRRPHLRSIIVDRRRGRPDDAGGFVLVVAALGEVGGGAELRRHWINAGQILQQCQWVLGVVLFKVSGRGAARAARNDQQNLAGRSPFSLVSTRARRAERGAADGPARDLFLAISGSRR